MGIRPRIAIGITALGIACGFGGTAAADALVKTSTAARRATYSSGRVLVKFHHGAARQVLPGSGAAHRFEGDPDLVLVENPAGMDVPGALSRYRSNPNVAYAEPDYIVSATDIYPTDPLWSQQWDMAKIAAPAAWSSQTNAGDVVVAVIDTGIDFTHPDLQANLWTNPADGTHGFTALNGVLSAGGQDDFGHGTHCAGTIGAVTNDAIGIAGINWNVKLLAMKFLDSSGSGSSSDAILLLDKCVSLKGQGVNIRVTSNSWGGGGFSQSLEDAFARAEAAGILSICAAGNNGQNADSVPMYPGAYDIRGIVSVQATDSNDAGASFSNFGLASTDIAAPGVSTLSTVPTGSCTLCDPSGYRLMSGTSMATPHVTGVAAALFHLNPALTPEQARDVLLDPGSFDRLADAKVVQSSTLGGRLNFAKAIANPLLASPKLNGFPAATAPASLTANAGSTVTLSATASDPDGDSLRTSWTKGRYVDTSWLLGKMIDSIFPASGGNPQTFTAPALGRDASVTYTVSTADGRGGSAAAQTSVNVPAATSAGAGPTGTLSVTPASGPAGTTVTVNFPAADPQGGPVFWDLVTNGNGSNGSCCYMGTSASLTFSTAGVYRVRSQAIDNRLNLSPSQSVLVSIGGATGVPPVASATSSPQSGPVPLTVSYDLSGSYDPDGSIVKFEVICEGIAFTETTNPKGSCTYTQPGPHLIHLYAVDNSGLWDSAYVYAMALPASGASAPADTTPPTVAISSPASGATVSGTVTLTATASDNVGVARVDYYVDGAKVGSCTASPWSVAWNTTAATAGTHTLTAVAFDAAGNSATSAPVTVTVANATDTTKPSVSVSSPANGSTVTRRSTVAIAAAASDNVGVTRVDFTVNGVLTCSDTVSPWTCAWNVPNGKAGKSYQLQAIAYDAAGNSASSAVVTVKTN